MKLTVTVVAVVILASSYVAAQAPAATEPLVVVTGEGLVKAAPDQAWVTLAAEHRSKNPKEAQSQIATAMTAVQERLAAARVPKDAIRTISYDLQLESDWINGRQVPRGYVARNTIEVRLDDITRVGEIIDLSITSGATAVHGVRFDLKQREALEQEALKRATANARARAEAAAAGAGSSIGRVVRIEEPGNRPFAPPAPMMMREAAQDARAAATPIAAGEIEIRAVIILTATLK